MTGYADLSYDQSKPTRLVINGKECWIEDIELRREYEEIRFGWPFDIGTQTIPRQTTATITLPIEAITYIEENKNDEQDRDEDLPQGEGDRRTAPACCGRCAAGASAG